MKIYLSYQLETDGTEVVEVFVLSRRAARPLLVSLLLLTLRSTPPPLLSSLIVVSITLILISIMFYTHLFCSAPLHSWLFPPSPLFSHRFTAPCLSLITFFGSH